MVEFLGFIVYMIIYALIAIAFIVGGLIFLNLAKKESQNKDNYCENCGNKVSANNSFCNNCGNKLHIHYNDSKRVAFLIIGAFLLVQGMGCLLVAIFQVIFRLIINYLYFY